MKLRPFAMAAAVIAMAWPLASQAAPGVGAKYGARDPRPCPASTGALSPALVTALVTCNAEHEFSNGLFLVENVKVQMGTSRMFTPGSDGRISDLDQRQPVYPIRGSFTKYSCSVPQPASGGAYHFPSTFGKNCRVYDAAHASGLCYKTTFGDWSCSMTDPSATSPLRTDAPPPR